MSKKSLVENESANQTGTALALPAGFERQTDIVRPSQSSVPYVTFASPKSKLWTTQSAAIPGLQEGDPILMRPNVDPVRLQPFKFHLLTDRQFFAVTAQDGSLVKTFDKDNRPDTKTTRTDEYVETVLLVYLPDGLVFARCTFKGAKCPAAHKAGEALDQANDLESWVKKSADHAISARLPHAFARFTCTCTNGPRRTARGSGLPYIPTQGNVAPVSAGDIQTLMQFFSVEDNKAKMQEAADNLRRRMDEVTSKRGS